VNDPTGKYPEVRVTRHLPIVPPAPIPIADPRSFEMYQKQVGGSLATYRRNHPGTFLHFNPYLGEPGEPEGEGSGNTGAIDEIVPGLFFDPGFTIEDAGTFSKVLEGEGALLAEKLSYYLDVVEVRLMESVSERSSSFFAALETLNQLHGEVGAACGAIGELREKVAALDARLARPALDLLRMRQEKENLLALACSVQLMDDVIQAKAAVPLLLSHAAYADALDLIVHAQALLAGPLAGLLCFKYLGVELSEKVFFFLFFFSFVFIFSLSFSSAFFLFPFSLPSSLSSTLVFPWVGTWKNWFDPISYKILDLQRVSIERVMMIEFSSALLKIAMICFDSEEEPPNQLSYESFELQFAPLFTGLARVNQLSAAFEVSGFKEVKRKMKSRISHLSIG